MRYLATVLVVVTMTACGEEATVGDQNPNGNSSSNRAFVALTSVVGHVYLNDDGFGGVLAATSLGKPSFDLPEGPELDQCITRVTGNDGLIGALNAVLQLTGSADLGSPVTLSTGGTTINLAPCVDASCTGYFGYTYENLSDDSDYLSAQSYQLNAPSWNQPLSLSNAVIAAPKFDVGQPADNSTFTPKEAMHLAWTGESDGFMYVLIHGYDSVAGEESAIECVLKDDGDFTVQASDIGLLSANLDNAVSVEFNRFTITSQKVAALGGEVVGVSLAEANVDLTN